MCPGTLEAPRLNRKPDVALEPAHGLGVRRLRRKRLRVLCDELGQNIVTGKPASELRSSPPAKCSAPSAALPNLSAMAAAVARGCCITSLTTAPEAQEALPRARPLRRPPGTPSRARSAAIAAPRYAREDRSVHSCEPPASASPASHAGAALPPDTPRKHRRAHRYPSLREASGHRARRRGTSFEHPGAIAALMRRHRVPRFRARYSAEVRRLGPFRHLRISTVILPFDAHRQGVIVESALQRFSPAVKSAHDRFPIEATAMMPYNFFRTKASSTSDKTTARRNSAGKLSRACRISSPRRAASARERLRDRGHCRMVILSRAHPTVGQGSDVRGRPTRAARGLPAGTC